MYALVVGNRTIPFMLRKSARARHFSIRIDTDATVTAVLPRGGRISQLLTFVEAKKQWIRERVELYESYEDTSLARLTRRDYLAHKETARALITQRIAHYASLIGVSPGRISIRNQKTCWGSCTQNGNLSFNYKLLFLSDSLRDYVVVHELCHLRELNHSKRFWELVAQIVPEYKEARQALKKIL